MDVVNFEDLIKKISESYHNIGYIGGYCIVREALVTPGFVWSDEMMNDFARMIQDKDLFETYGGEIMKKISDMLDNDSSFVADTAGNIADFYLLRFHTSLGKVYNLRPSLDYTSKSILGYKLREPGTTSTFIIPLKAVVERDPNVVNIYNALFVNGMSISDESKRELYKRFESDFFKGFLKDLASPPSIPKATIRLPDSGRTKIFRMWDKEKGAMLTTADEYSCRTLELCLAGKGKSDGDFIGFGEFENENFVIMEGKVSNKIKGSRVLYDYDIFVENKGYCTEKRGVIRIIGDEIVLQYMDNGGDVVKQISLAGFSDYERLTIDGNIFENRIPEEKTIVL